VEEHCAAAFVASHLRTLPDVVTRDLTNALGVYSAQLGCEFGAPFQSLETLMETPPTQRILSSKLEQLHSAALCQGMSLADSLRFRAVSAPRAAAWLSALPCHGPLNLSLAADQVQVTLQHRLGLSVAEPGEKCSYCGAGLDILGHHHMTCGSGDFRTSRHNRLRDSLSRLLSAAGMSPRLEQGADERDLRRPADILVPDYKLGKSAAFDLTVVSPLTQHNLSGAGDFQYDAVSRAASLKHEENDEKCAALNWLCVPLAVDSYGQWCDEAHVAFAEIASRLSTRTKVTLSSALSSIFNTLGVVLARHNAIAILARRAKPFQIGAREVLSTSPLLRS
jgi:hypothetical protein